MKEEYIIWTAIGLLILVVLYLASRNAALQMRQDHLRKELEKLKYRNTALEIQQLKYALQPHTLNNILANIKAMSNIISRSMDSLSSLLEYIFYHGENHYASIEKEVDFIIGYLNLQDTFTMQNNISIDCAAMDENNPYYSQNVIPHLITAYLIENAFKHGDAHHPDFLKINISLQQNMFEITVINKVRKNYQSKKTGIGLKNMKERLRHLKDGKHVFTSNHLGEDFIVNLKINLK